MCFAKLADERALLLGYSAAATDDFIELNKGDNEIAHALFCTGSKVSAVLRSGETAFARRMLPTSQGLSRRPEYVARRACYSAPRFYNSSHVRARDGGEPAEPGAAARRAEANEQPRMVEDTLRRG